MYDSEPDDRWNDRDVKVKVEIDLKKKKKIEKPLILIIFRKQVMLRHNL